MIQDENEMIFCEYLLMNVRHLIVSGDQFEGVEFKRTLDGVNVCIVTRGFIRSVVSVDVTRVSIESYGPQSMALRVADALVSGVRSVNEVYDAYDENEAHDECVEGPVRPVTDGCDGYDYYECSESKDDGVDEDTEEPGQ